MQIVVGLAGQVRAVHAVFLDTALIALKGARIVIAVDGDDDGFYFGVRAVGVFYAYVKGVFCGFVVVEPGEIIGTGIGKRARLLIDFKNAELALDNKSVAFEVKIGFIVQIITAQSRVGNGFSGQQVDQRESKAVPRRYNFR
nr:hypothetical protein [Desulfovibrio sp. 86]